jgi:hypothetical protein
MAIVAYYGHPSFFITFTANPKWVEITIELLPGQTTSNCPDLVSQVFHMKAKILQDELFHDGIFGHAVAQAWCIEYQKQGLPHTHILLWLKNCEIYLQLVIIDQIISAEVPTVDWNNDPELANLVKSQLIHSPCLDNLNAPCMVKDIKTGHIHCSKHFPKEFSDKTVVNESGYPIYC